MDRPRRARSARLDYAWAGELTDSEWRRIEPLVERTNPLGRPHRDNRNLLNGILWVIGTGAPWRDLPPQYGPWQTAYTRYRIWSGAGTLDRVLERIRLGPSHLPGPVANRG